MNDMQAVREAENRLRSCAGDWRLFPYPTAPDDMKTLADAYISLTDPTPLTLERLVEAGFNPCRIDGHFSRGRLEAARIGKGFDFWVGDTPLQLPPRTVGHLRQLLLRMGEQS